MFYVGVHDYWTPFIFSFYLVILDVPHDESVNQFNTNLSKISLHPCFHYNILTEIQISFYKNSNWNWTNHNTKLVLYSKKMTHFEKLELL